MEPNTHFEYIQWRNPEGLHEDTLVSMSDLKFLKDELHFLTKLVSSGAIGAAEEKKYDNGSTTIQKLQVCKTEVDRMLKVLQQHSNQLKQFVDEKGMTHGLQNYKDAHYNLMISTMKLYANVKTVKQDIFKRAADHLRNQPT